MPTSTTMPLQCPKQGSLFSITPSAVPTRTAAPFKQQLLKWVGNKQRQAPAIVKHFPKFFGTYYEPFLGSGGILGVLAPKKAVAGDIFKPLIEIWQTLHNDIYQLELQYTERYALMDKMGKAQAYQHILNCYNQKPNGADLLFLCRACYGGVVRFRKRDGHMSTPVGAHTPIAPAAFAQRAHEWSRRTQGVTFIHANYTELFELAQPGDLIYCDPPYSDSQSILYGAQAFKLDDLFNSIEHAKKRGVFIALSIDGTKFSGKKTCAINIPPSLFKNEIYIDVGRSMLKRFQMDGHTLEDHQVTDRLLLTY